MKSKSLVKKMIHSEVITYILNHPDYHIPTSLEAEMIDDAEHRVFLVDEEIGGHLVVYDKQNQCYKTTHPLFKQNVVLVKKESTK